MRTVIHWNITLFYRVSVLNPKTASIENQYRPITNVNLICGKANLCLPLIMMDIIVIWRLREGWPGTHHDVSWQITTCKSAYQIYYGNYMRLELLQWQLWCILPLSEIDLILIRCLQECGLVFTAKYHCLSVPAGARFGGHRRSWSFFGAWGISILSLMTITIVFSPTRARFQVLTTTTVFQRDR